MSPKLVNFIVVRPAYRKLTDIELYNVKIKEKCCHKIDSFRSCFNNYYIMIKFGILQVNIEYRLCRLYFYLFFIFKL